MLYAQAVAPQGQVLGDDAVCAAFAQGLAGRFSGQRVLVLVPDHTRTLPLPLLFRTVIEALHDAARVDVMVALGTHLPLSPEALHRLLGINAEERATVYKHVTLLNHAWDDPDALATISTFTRAQVQDFAGPVWHPSLGGDLPIRINRAALEADQILIVGPTFPHEVVGFSGGAKYLWPGISGPEMINVTHWLGALITILQTIGIADTPMRRMIHAAAALLPTPVTLAALVVEHDGLAGVFIGEHLEAHQASAELSAQRHVVWLDRPYQRVLSHAPVMYDELWTAAKAMYKLEPGIADGGEVVVYAPHLQTISEVHGHYLRRIGYHVRDYFLGQWAQFQDVPLGVLAHSTHLKGSGMFVDGIERPRIQVTLASRVPREVCEAINLGYQDPATIRIDEWRDREDEGVLYVPKAGEQLYRVRTR